MLLRIRTNSIVLSLLPAAAVLAAVGGCASHNASSGSSLDAAAETPSARIAVAPGAYASTFDAAKTTLRDLGFLLERVDAQGGVITTRPLGSAGIAAPWDRVQSGIDQEFEDVGQRQVRIVRIDFVPAGTPADAPRPDDLRSSTRPIEGHVVVSVHRLYASGLRVNNGNIGRSTYTVDTELESRGMINYAVAVKEDRRLADRIVQATVEGAAKSEQAHAVPAEPSK